MRLVLPKRPGFQSQKYGMPTYKACKKLPLILLTQVSLKVLVFVKGLCCNKSSDKGFWFD